MQQNVRLEAHLDPSPMRVSKRTFNRMCTSTQVPCNNEIDNKIKLTSAAATTQQHL